MHSIRISLALSAMGNEATMVAYGVAISIRPFYGVRLCRMVAVRHYFSTMGGKYTSNHGVVGMGSCASNYKNLDLLVSR